MDTLKALSKTLQLNINTLAVLICGLYCGSCELDPMAIPESVWLEIAEKLSDYMDDWDYDKISFEDFIQNHLLILPTIFVDEPILDDMKQNTMYWERVNGNTLLSISLDTRIFGGEDVE